jgi:hypothetical protein
LERQSSRLRSQRDLEPNHAQIKNRKREGEKKKKEPVPDSWLIKSTLSVGVRSLRSFCKPSRGETSTILTAVGYDEGD